MTLTELDTLFTNHYRGLLAAQQRIVQQLKDYTFDLKKEEMTQAVIGRMEAFWHFHVNNNKVLLDRKINTAADDCFTETCLLFFKAYFEQKEGYKVYSERVLSKDVNIRPDISIWKDDQLVAVVELKVSSGWMGKHLAQHLLQREKKIKESFPQAYFGALVYWNCFKETDKNPEDKKSEDIKPEDNEHKVNTGEKVDDTNKPLYILKGTGKVIEKEYYGLFHHQNDHNHQRTGAKIENIITAIEAKINQPIAKASVAVG